MKPNFLFRIEGLRSEDLSTEVLSIVLEQYTESNENVKSFISEVLKSNLNLELDFRVSTQERYDCGRPDIQIVSNESVILIENKISADFTEKQLDRYCDILKSHFTDRQKFLYLLTPEKSEREYTMEAKNQLQLKNLDLRKETKVGDITFKNIVWEEVCEFTSTKGEIGLWLSEYMSEYHLKNQKIEGGVMNVANSKDFPNLIESVQKTISSSRDFLAERKYSVSRMTHTAGVFSYYVELKWGCIIVQNYIEFWKKYEAPFTLQLVMEDKYENKFSSEFLKQNDFVYDDEYGFILNVKATENIEKDFNMKLLKLIETFKAN